MQNSSKIYPNRGTPWYVVYEGAAASHFMTRIGYDMMAIGNHEFDNGVESFGEHFIGNVTENGRTAFPINGCNIDFSPYASFQIQHWRLLSLFETRTSSLKRALYNNEFENA